MEDVNSYIGLMQLVGSMLSKMKMMHFKREHWQGKDDLHQPWSAGHPDCQWPTDYCSGEFISYTGFDEMK